MRKIKITFFLPKSDRTRGLHLKKFDRKSRVNACVHYLSVVQAEELNLIIGNAFKMAYAQQRDKQPTFHELIEAQVAEQQAKFREIEKQAQVRHHFIYSD